MNSKEYWLNRVDEIFDNHYRQKKIKRIYREAYKAIEDDILKLYNDYANAGEITTTKLYRYDRFQSLLASIKKQCRDIRGTLTKDVTDTLFSAYKDTFGETEQLLGTKSPWGIQNQKHLEAVLNTKWAGNHYSKRIWNNTSKLAKRIESDITTAITRGVNKNVFVKQIQNDFGVGFREADRLVRTELARAINQGQLDTYKDEGIKKVEWSAAHDDRTCGICERYDGRIFDIDKSPVILHPNCRCTILPILDDINDVDEQWQQWLDERNLKEADGDLIDKATGKPAALEKKTPDIHYIGKLDTSIYKCVTGDIKTDDVIITDERIRHIKNRHPNDYEKYYSYMDQIISNPEYIIEANKPNTALILKSFEGDGQERFKTVLKLATSIDNQDFKNSIITFMKINEKEWNRLIKNKKILYKLE